MLPSLTAWTDTAEGKNQLPHIYAIKEACKIPVRVTSLPRGDSSLETGSELSEDWHTGCERDSEVRNTAALSEDLRFGPQNPHGAHNHL